MLEYYGADPEYSLEGKTALITGGAAGIGLATAEFFAKKGANLVLADLNPNVNEVAKRISKNAIGVAGNITKQEDREAVLEEGIKAFGKIDILVNSAGIVALESAEKIEESDWDKTIEINLKATFMQSQLMGKYFIENKIPGTIVNMASQAGVIALDKHVAYCASKGGVIAMTKVLAYEWGKYGIRVNAVSPTVVLTELGHKAWDGPVGDAFKEEMPSKRFAEPDEIAGVIAFLCSGAAAMITGHNLLVDGGFTIK
ncbi:NAD(P)-dependent dehydrogenase (short-subunit alcohol dehydrogenase family) [Aequitasia blattaphilus]|uniref:D-threitol dehydrogenase n=1 Tax=Aequitasia blattaphilus TaxID=2949332 RepID=A0ABT1EC81_9FIRM|nr:D-threitol dehydrogenase [Aequitasia blattaphilus]MCP1103286.1 D-threitol dehydrogenase [Aequitasia blattaphilus]MCR8615926.1 D-threitol dehydrogenase [Aequitasia blattaphilus]